MYANTDFPLDPPPPAKLLAQTPFVRSRSLAYREGDQTMKRMTRIAADRAAPTLAAPAADQFAAPAASAASDASENALQRGSKPGRDSPAAADPCWGGLAPDAPGAWPGPPEQQTGNLLRLGRDAGTDAGSAFAVRIALPWLATSISQRGGPPQ